MRKKQKLTQADIAQLLGIKQENVSRLERRNNVHLSTLKDYIHALGGKLHLIVEFPNQKPIEIKDVESIESPKNDSTSLHAQNGKKKDYGK